MNRRDLLKFFGAGTVVAPVVEGVALATDHARLIQPAQVEVVQAMWDVVNPYEHLTAREELDVTVFMRGKKSGKVTRMDCSVYMIRASSELMNVTHHIDQFKRLIPVQWNCTLEITGEVRMAKKS